MILSIYFKHKIFIRQDSFSNYLFSVTENVVLQWKIKNEIDTFPLSVLWLFLSSSFFIRILHRTTKLEILLDLTLEERKTI